MSCMVLYFTYYFVSLFLQPVDNDQKSKHVVKKNCYKNIYRPNLVVSKDNILWHGKQILKSRLQYIDSLKC